MTNPPITADSLQSLWQSMPTESIVVSAEQMRARSLKFERRIRRRNMIEYVAAAVVVAAFSWYATWPEPATPLWPVANLMIVAAALYVGWKLHRHGAARKADPEASVAGLIAFHRAELARQRDGLVTVWRWYLLPFVPGVVLWFTAMGIGASQHGGPAAAVMPLVLGASVLMFILVFAGVFALNLLAAAHLQRQIDDLDRYVDTNGDKD
jgi:hypothetical protein